MTKQAIERATPHKHDWQLLHFGSKPTGIGTEENMVVLIVCRDCGKVVEKKVEAE